MRIRNGKNISYLNYLITIYYTPARRLYAQKNKLNRKNYYEVHKVHEQTSVNIIL